MLDIRLELAQVDHQNCVEMLLPLLVEHCAAKAAPNELDRFLAALGRDAVPAACSLLRGMSVDEKDALIVWLVAAHEVRMRSSANRHLAELFGAPVIRVGQVAALDRPGTRLALLAQRVDIDYRALLRSPLVEDGIEQIGAENSVLKSAARLAVRMGSHLSPAQMEKQGLALLNAAKVKGRLMTVLQEAVRQAGLDVTVADMIVERSGAIALPAQLSADGGMIADDYARSLLRALAERAEALRKAREQA